MDSKKLFLLTGHLIMWAYAAMNVLFIVRADVVMGQFAGKEVPTYSIYSGKDIFIAYNVWGIILAAVCSYSLYKEIRILFMISLMLLIIVMFYPWFTQ